MERKRRANSQPVKAAFLNRVERSTLARDICRELVMRLVRGDWVEAEQIPPEWELCQRLNAGRSSVREAIKALELMGMIETRPGKGMFVCRRSEFFSSPLLGAIIDSNMHEAQELVEARCLMEVELAGLAAERATADDMKEIGNSLDRMEANLHDVIRFQEADIDFHLAVGRAAHNRILQDALELIRNMMRQWVRRVLEQDGLAFEAFDQHREIFLAIAARNPKSARGRMRQHLETMAGYLLEQRQNQALLTESHSSMPWASNGTGLGRLA